MVIIGCKQPSTVNFERGGVMIRRIYILTLFALLIPHFAHTTPVSGPVSGIWDPSGNPYEVIGDLNIPAWQNLEVQPGVIVIFQGAYRFDIFEGATLYAAGTADDSITFTAQDTSVHWLYLYFQTSHASTLLEYCLFEYGGSTDINTGYGAVTIQTCDITVRNCTFRRNHARWGGAIYCRESANPLIEGCDIYDNWVESSGGGLGCSFNVNATVIDCDIYGNSAINYGGGIYVYSGSNMTMSNCKIFNNVSTSTTSNYGGGGIYFAQTTTGSLDSCWIYDNQVQNGIGGGISLNNATVQVNRTVICFNSASENGGGVCMTRSTNTDTTFLLHCDIYSNNATVSGGGIWDDINYSNQTTVENTVLWGNTAPANPEFYGNFRFNYCDVPQTLPGIGNINAEPMFIYPDTLNFYLQAGSPCIDAGDPDSLNNDPDGTIGDMGVFYFPQSISIKLSPDTLYFDTTFVGAVDSNEFWVVNLLNEAVTLDSLVNNTAHFWTPDTILIIQSGDSASLPAVFTPMSNGMFIETIFAYSRGIEDSIVLSGYGQGEFYAHPDTLQFGSNLLGHSSTAGLWVVNPNLVEITIDSIIFSDSAFTQEVTPFMIPSEDSVEVIVTFIPYRNGTYSDTIQIFAMNMVCETWVLGEGYGFYLEPDYLDFGMINVGSEDTLIVQAQNLGALEISIDSVTFVGEHYYVAGDSLIIPPEDTLDLSVVFAPISSGGQADTAVFHTSAGRDTVELSGFGLGWIIIPDTLNFGTLTVEEYDTLSFNIINYEAEDLIVDSMVCMSSAYIIEQDTFTINQGDTAEVPVIFHPLQSGNYNYILWVYTNRAIDDVRLLGYATAAGLSNQGNTVFEWHLSEPYPNPFNNRVLISFTLPREDAVKLMVYDILGREVAVLAEGKMNLGAHDYIWQSGNAASGLYFIVLKTSEGEKVRKVVLNK